MPAGPDGSPSAAVAPEHSGLEVDDDHSPVAKCGRCRLSFVLHPSATPGDSPKWWLCPPCRARLLGDEAKTDARWRRSPGRPRILADQGAVENPRVEETSGTHDGIDER